MKFMEKVESDRNAFQEEILSIKIMMEILVEMSEDQSKLATREYSPGMIYLAKKREKIAHHFVVNVVSCWATSTSRGSLEFTDKLSVLEFMIIRLESSTRIKLGPK